MGPRVMSKPPKYCQIFEDRHGKLRCYFRRHGYKPVAIPGLPWAPEFMAAYEAAMKGDKPEIGASQTKGGTVNAVVISYYRSANFRTLAGETQRTYRGILERFRVEHGDKSVARLQAKHVAKMLGDKADKPAAANHWLRLMKIILDHAVTMGIRKDNPAFSVKPIRRKSAGFATWSESEIRQFEDRWPIGTRERFAFALCLFTAQRRSDVVRMGPQHIRDGVLSIRQKKTGTLVEIPVHSELVEILKASPRGNLAFLVTSQGAPFTAPGFTNFFHEAVKSAGLPSGLSPHGLRKAACRRIAEATGSAHEIMSVSGHKTLSEVARYTEAASRAGLAISATEKVEKMFKRNVS